MPDELDDFRRFMKTREEAARAYVNGDAAPLGRIAARSGDASFFGPDGTRELGGERVATRYVRDAAAFASGETDFEILQIGASDGLAYWVGFQHASVRFRGKDEPVSMKLRITELFQRQGGEWKMVHRHADPFKADEKAEK